METPTDLSLSHNQSMTLAGKIVVQASANISASTGPTFMPTAPSVPPPSQAVPPMAITTSSARPSIRIPAARFRASAKRVEVLGIGHIVTGAGSKPDPLLIGLPPNRQKRKHQQVEGSKSSAATRIRRGPPRPSTNPIWEDEDGEVYESWVLKLRTRSPCRCGGPNCSPRAGIFLFLLLVFQSKLKHLLNRHSGHRCCIDFDCYSCSFHHHSKAIQFRWYHDRLH